MYVSTLELEVQAVVSHLTWGWEQSSGPLEDHFKLLSHRSSPYLLFLQTLYRDVIMGTV